MVFEEESNSSDEDTNKVLHKDSDYEGPDELAFDKEVPDEIDSNKLNCKNLDLDVMVTLAAVMLTSKTSSLEAWSLRYSSANKLG